MVVERGATYGLRQPDHPPWLARAGSASTPASIGALLDSPDQRRCVVDCSMVEAPAPVVEMLWEPVDPNDTLRTRFGFDSTAAVVAWIAAALDGLWGVRVASCQRIVMSDSNALAWVSTSSGPMIAKWSIAPERFVRLAALARLTAWLAQEGLPVSPVVPTRSGQVQAELHGVSVCLQREIAGSLLDTSDPLEVRAAGAALSRLHDALANFPDIATFPAPDASSVRIADRVNRWLGSAPEHIPPAARDALRRLVAEAPPAELLVQLVHGDFRSANVLCARREVAAVIDFEEARFDHRIVELGRSAALLGTRFHSWGPVSPEVHSEFLHGYESVRPLAEAEAAWWHAMVLWPSLMMVPAGEDQAGWASAALALVSDLGLRS